MFPYGTYGRSVIDDVVRDNRSTDIELYNMVIKAPQYQGYVQIGAPRLELFSNINNTHKLSLITDVINAVEQFKFTPNNGLANLTIQDQTGVTKREVPVDLAKVIKTCAILAVSKSIDMSTVLATFAATLMVQSTKFGGITLPIKLPDQNKLQVLIGKELNEWFAKYCEVHSIPTVDIVSEAKEQVKKSLFDAAKV